MNPLVLALLLHLHLMSQQPQQQGQQTAQGTQKKAAAPKKPATSQGPNNQMQTNLNPMSWMQGPQGQFGGLLGFLSQFAQPSIYGQGGNPNG